MEIKIIDEYNHQEISVALSADINSEIEFYKDNIFVENGLYSIFINFETDNNISYVRMFLEDICLDVQFDEFTNTAYLYKKRIFEDCFDVVSIRFEIDYDDGSIEVLKTPNVYVAIKKTTCQYVQNMFQDIEDNYPGVIDAFYSAGKKKVGIADTETRGFNDTISLLSTIYTILRDAFPMFQQSINKTIGEQYKYSKGINVGNLDNQAVNWILTHPECIKQSSTPTPIRVNQKYYFVDRINFLDKKESCETYENQMILGFIHSIILYINDKCLELEKIIKEFENEIPYDEIKKLPKDYDLAYNSVIFHYKELFRILKNYSETFENLFDAYSSRLQCDLITVTSVPRYTFIFRQQYHYRRCFEAMVLWFEASNCNLQSIGCFLKLKKLSKLFEYYTLMKLKEAVLKNDFKLYDEPQRLVYENDTIVDVDNYYSYISKNGETKLSIYYEPHIYNNKTVNGIDLYSTGYHFLKILKENRIRKNEYWTPDFVLKFDNSGKCLYFILDSKFSAYSSVCNYHIAELANKYVLSIASENEYYSKVAGVWAIYPSDKSQRLNLKKNLIDSSKISIPIIAIEPLLTQGNSLIALVKYMNELYTEVYKDVIE